MDGIFKIFSKGMLPIAIIILIILIIVIIIKNTD